MVSYLAYLESLSLIATHADDVSPSKIRELYPKGRSFTLRWTEQGWVWFVYA